jgi:hypothetical protein
MSMYFYIQPAIWVLSCIWAAQLPNVNFTVAWQYALVVGLSYLPYVHQWYAPAYVPKNLWTLQTNIFGNYVIVVQKSIWLLVLWYLTGLTPIGMLMRAFAQPLPVIVLGFAIVAFGQWLNISVFNAIGWWGVFYGHRYGKQCPWVHGWPFVLPDPQYLGVTLTFLGGGILSRSDKPGEENGWILGATAGNALAHVFIVQMERWGETRNAKKVKA